MNLDKLHIKGCGYVLARLISTEESLGSSISGLAVILALGKLELCSLLSSRLPPDSQTRVTTPDRPAQQTSLS